MSSPLRSASSRFRRTRSLPFIVLGTGLLVTLIGWNSVRQELARAEMARFERLKERVVATVYDRFDSVEQALFAGRTLVEPLPELPHAQWAAFAASMNHFLDRAVIGVGFVQRVERDKIGELETKVRADGLPKFTVERVGQNPFAYVVTHIEPLALNSAALGLDIGSGNTRRTAAEEAMRQNLPIISRRINLIEANRTVPGCLLLLPVYRAGLSLATPQARTQALRGWIYGSLRIDLMMQSVNQAMDGQLDLELYEGDTAVSTTLMYDSTKGLELSDASWPKIQGSAGVAAINLPLYGRSWLLRMRVLPEFVARGNARLSGFFLGAEF